jgi:outer membrane protein insertion porin family
MKRRLLSSAIGLLLGTSAALAADPFVVSDIRVEGLQRISAGAVFAAMPVNVGDTVGDDTLRSTIRNLFKTGNFDDVSVGRDGTVMVVSVKERPSISEIVIEGNKQLKTEDLTKNLEKAGLSEGQVFKRSTLEQMRQELGRAYAAQGRYDAHIQTEVVAQPRNRVSVRVSIEEGETAKIKHINIVGNTVFDDATLTELFELKSTGWWSWLTGNDKYAKEKLKGDIEKLNSYYLDRGYVNFRVESTQVSLSPDREQVYITFNVNEGSEYQFGDVDLSGNIILPEAELRKFVLIEKGKPFSQALVTNTEKLITTRLGNEGYNFAKVKGIPDIDEKGRFANIKFFVDPGKRTYVRRIEFSGNNKTADEVLRREMRQMEAAPASSDKIEQSRVRLERLGYFKEARVETLEVPGTDDLIDIKYSVEEQPSGSIGASVGYAQDAGLLLGANLQQDNFLGSGKSVGIGVNKSQYLLDVRFNYVNPYYTEDGVSRGFSVFYREADLGEINVANYSVSSKGATLNFSYPIEETERLTYALGYANTTIDPGYGSPKEVIGSPRPLKGIDSYYRSLLNPDGTYQTPVAPATGEEVQSLNDPTIFRAYEPTGFLDQYGDSYDDFTLTVGWVQSTLNRGQLATRGHAQNMSLEVSVPGSDLEYYKLSYSGQMFVPLTDSLTLRFRTELGYGDGLGDLDGLPFFNNFYAGGFSSVRGFRSNTLGPRGTPADIYRTGVACTTISSGTCSALAGEYSYVVDPATGQVYVDPIESRKDSAAFGGNVLVEGGIELLFPLPFVKDQRSLRSAVFVDGGNVFSTNCSPSQLNCFSPDFNELRYSAGFGVTWITGFGPLTFSVAKALNKGEYDETEFFQFSIGRGF